jgi:NADPH-dependent curcumin reductase CurA
MTASREIHLATRPVGWPTPDNFRFVDVELPDRARTRCWYATSSCPSTRTCAVA